jgi:FixJ family two-component response regulator
LLVTDVVMPGMNGRTLANSLLGIRPEIQVLYMSGYTDDVIAQRGVLEPGTLLLEKPFTATALLERVRGALDKAAFREPDLATSP